MVSQGQPCYYHEHRPALPHPFAESVRKSQTRITHGECSGFFVTDCQRDEVKRAGVQCNTVAPSRPLLLKVFVSIVDRIQVQQITTPL